MSVSRRSFVKVFGAGSAGALALPFLTARGHEALAATGDETGTVSSAADTYRLDSNENPRGALPSVLAAVRGALGETSRYPYQVSSDIRAAIARAHGVKPENVLVGCGSGEILRVGVDAFCSPARALVTALPTYEGPANRANTLGIPLRALRVTADLGLDLAAMAAASRDAGMVFLCNPNNPTGTVHSASAVKDFVNRVQRESEATVVVDEAYHEYCDHPSYESALPLALASPRIVVVRTFSKAYGLAGLRVGYAIAQAPTISAMQRHRLANGVNVLGGVAAIAALNANRSELARERTLNREGRDMTAKFFRDLGFTVTPSQANFVLIDIRRDVRRVQEAAKARGVLVGRPFPPLDTHLRVSIGTADEMRVALPLLAEVLGARG